MMLQPLLPIEHVMQMMVCRRNTHMSLLFTQRSTLERLCGAALALRITLACSLLSRW